MIQTTRGKNLRFHPDQRRHTATLSITPEREEPRRIAVGAPAAAEYVTNTQRRETTPCEHIQIALPTTARVSLECHRCAQVIFHEGSANVVTDLEIRLADRGAEPSHQLCR